MSFESQPDGRAVIGRALALVVLYAAAAAVGGALLIALLRLGAAAFGPGVLFYRGLGALCGVFLLLILLLVPLLSRLPRRFGLDAADSPGVAIVATSLLLAVFLLGPVTVDRSVSVFMLTQFDAVDRPLTAQQVRDAFVSVYVDDWVQIDRRLTEQVLSGNLEHTAEGWRLTPRGRAFVKTARLTSEVFGADPRFVGRKD